jgi:hypothetical protein
MSKKVKIKKEFREKGKSKYLFYRDDLKHKPNYESDGDFLKQQKEQVKNNIERRGKLKINQPKHPDSYYADCYVNSQEYKNKNVKL